MTERLAPSVRHVRALEGDFYLLREAAEMLNVSHRTLRNFIVNGPDTLKPSFFTYMGKVLIYCYTDDDIDRLRKHLVEQRIVYPSDELRSIQHKGRPPKWSVEERKDRQRKFSQIHYYKNMAAKHAAENQITKAERALAKMHKIQEELRQQDMKQTYAEK